MKKTLMCAFLALSLVGGQLSAYSMEDEVTPSRLGCVMLTLGQSKEAAKKKVEEHKKNGIRGSNGVKYNYKSTLGYERFYNDAGEKAKFQDLPDLKGKSAAIEKSDDLCANKFFVGL